jgi:transcriptional regulator with XRE-family HTH domain
MPQAQKLAMKLKALRKRQGITQAELAFKARLSPGYVARLEIGRHEPTLTTLRKLARVLKVKVADLLE